MSTVNIATSAVARLLVGVLALAVLAACGGEEDTGASSGDETTSETPTVEPEDVVDVPEGVTLTDPGTELAWGKPAVVAWQPRQDKVVPAKVTVRRVERTSFDAAFEGFRITDEMAAMTPYFVRAKVVNPTAQNLGNKAVPLYVEDDAGTLIEPTVLQGDFEPCPGGVLPKKFKKNAKTNICLVYLVTQQRSFEAVTMLAPGGLEPIRWTGKVRKYQPANADDDS